MWDRIFINMNAAAMTRGGAPYGAVPDAALAVEAGRIAWIGPRADLPVAPERLAHEVVDLSGAWMTPALIDCHTHAVFAGTRAREFEMRLEGASYEDIARSGGGILSTVRATRAASLDALAETAAERLRRLKAGGVAAVEIKSGYGLTLDDEIKMLRAAALAGERAGVRVVRTFLGAHALPPEYAENRAGYLDLVCNEMIPAVAREGLAEAVDAFCEGIGFTPEETRRVFQAARAHGLRVKLHAEQLSDQGGAALAASFGALSADHLEWLSADGIAAMAKAGTLAVLLPAAFYALRETRLPPVEALRAAGVPMAVATDCNPGTAPALSPRLMLNMACTLFRLTPEEALAGMTREGARALGRGDTLGALEQGKAADLAVWRIGEPAELSYWIGAGGPERLVIAGRDA